MNWMVRLIEQEPADENSINGEPLADIVDNESQYVSNVIANAIPADEAESIVKRHNEQIEAFSTPPVE